MPHGFIQRAIIVFTIGHSRAQRRQLGQHLLLQAASTQDVHHKAAASAMTGPIEGGASNGGDADWKQAARGRQASRGNDAAIIRSGG